MDTIKIEKEHIKSISDGGNSITEIAQTYPALLGACNKSYSGILCTIKFTKDRHIILSKNRKIKSLDNKIYNIATSNYQNLSEITFNRPFSYITKLEDAAKLIKLYNKELYIKIPSPIGHLELEQLYNEISSYNIEHNKLILCSEHLSILKYFRNKNFDIRLEYINNKFNDELLTNCIKYHLQLTLNISECNQDLIDMLHSYNILVGVYNINNPIDAKLLDTYQIDYFYTSELE